MNETKNYASLRFSKRFGKENDKLSLAFNQKEIIEWFKSMKPDERGLVRVIVAPRLNPSAANCVTVFEDTFQPKPASERPQRMSREQVQEKMKPAKDAASNQPPESDDVPF